MKKLDFNRNWSFSKDQGGWFPAADAKQVTLPHDAMILEKRDPNSNAGAAGGYFQGGDYQYTKMLETTAEDAGKTFMLQFEGIYNRGWVFVNGALAGTVQSGYDELLIDITPYLYIGTQNVIQ